MLERRTWVITAWQGALAALWVAIIAVSAYAASNMRDLRILLDENRRAVLATFAMSDDQRLHAAGKSIAAIAPIVVQRVQSDRDMVAAVVDDRGKLIAGDKEAMTGVVLPILDRAPQGFQLFAAPGFSKVSTQGPRGFGQHNGPPPDVFGGQLTNSAFGPMHPPSMGFGANATVVRLNGGWLVVSQRPNAFGDLGGWYWPAAALITLLSFATVWSLGRRTLVHAIRPVARVERGLRRFAGANGSTIEAIASDDAGLAAPLIESYNAAVQDVATVLRQRAELEPRIRQFVADAGHELRTPLAVIMGYVQLLRDRQAADSSMVERVFSEIEGQGERMTLLIRKLLLLTRLESQEPRDVKILDALEIAQSVADSFRPLAGDAAIAVHGEPGALVKVSESELRDMIGNLLDNAIKYAPAASIDVSVRAQDEFVFVSVSDNGPGMSPELRARAFERFSRGETAGAVPGSGLGLAIVETAAERAGGTVSLRTAPGQGTMVEVRFPLLRRDAAK